MPHRVTTPQDLLLLLHQYQYLTIKQVVKLLEKESTVNHIREKIQALVQSGHIEVQPHITPFIYSLTKKGQRSLADGALPDAGKKSGVAVYHTLDINDVAILAHLIGRAVPEIRLFEWRHESVLKTHAILISEKGRGKEKEPVSLVPDLFTHFLLFPPFTAKAHAPFGVLYEIERGTEDAYTIKEKLRKYVALSYGLYEQHFGLQSLTVVFVVTVGGMQRVRQLLTWAQQELKNNREDAELFLFAACDPATIDPVSFFTHPLWLQPFASAPVPLIEKKSPAPINRQFQQPVQGGVKSGARGSA